MPHPEPLLYACNALAYLCEAERLRLEREGVRLETPEMPGAGWILESAEALCQDEDDEEDPDEVLNRLVSLQVQ